MLIRYTVAGSGRSSTFVSEAGRRRGILGQLAFRAMASVTSMEPGAVRAGNGISGKIRPP